MRILPLSKVMFTIESEWGKIEWDPLCWDPKKITTLFINILGAGNYDTPVWIENLNAAIQATALFWQFCIGKQSYRRIRYIKLLELDFLGFIFPVDQIKKEPEPTPEATKQEEKDPAKITQQSTSTKGPPEKRMRLQWQKGRLYSWTAIQQGKEWQLCGGLLTFQGSFLLNCLQSC